MMNRETDKINKILEIFAVLCVVSILFISGCICGYIYTYENLKESQQEMVSLTAQNSVLLAKQSVFLINLTRSKVTEYNEGFVFQREECKYIDENKEWWCRKR